MQQSGTRGWEVRLMLFNAMMVQVLIYGVEFLGGTTQVVHGMNCRKSKNCTYIDKWG